LRIGITHNLILITFFSFRYKVDEDFGINTGINKLDSLETDLRTRQAELVKKEAEKTENKKPVEDLRKAVGTLRDELKTTFRGVKQTIGSELYNRFMKGFVRTRDNAEENDRIAHSEFLFKKLKF